MREGVAGRRIKEFLNVLVTEGAGFIGSRLLDTLMIRSHNVIVLDNFWSGRMENVSQHLKSDNFKLVEGDVRDRRAVSKTARHITGKARILNSVTFL